MIFQNVQKIAYLASFEFANSFRLFLRYPMSSFVAIMVMIIVFIGLFETATGIVGGVLLENIDVEYTIQKFILWTTMIMGFAAISGSVRDQTLSGMIETVWMGCVPPAVTLTIRGVAAIMITLVLNLILTFLLAILYQKLGVFTPEFIICLFLVAIFSLGVGLILGAAVVVFKEIGPALNLLQFIMLPLFMNDSGYLWKGAELIAPGLYSLRYLNGGPEPYWGIFSAIIWLGIGFCCMSLAVYKSRKEVLIYHY